MTKQVKFGIKWFPARVIVLPEYAAGNNGTKVVGVATTVNAFDNIANDPGSEPKSTTQIERSLEIGADDEITKVNNELFTKLQEPKPTQFSALAASQRVLSVVKIKFEPKTVIVLPT